MPRVRRRDAACQTRTDADVKERGPVARDSGPTVLTGWCAVNKRIRERGGAKGRAKGLGGSRASKKRALAAIDATEQQS